MRLSKQLLVIVLIALLGLISLNSFSLLTLKDNMLQNRQHEIKTVLDLAVQEANYYIQLAENGEITREQARQEIINNLTHMRKGSSYVWARDADGILLVHPLAEGIGKRDMSKLPDGSYSYDRFVSLLQIQPYGFVKNDILKPGTQSYVTKVNGITKIPGWNWIIGFGVFMDDVDKTFWSFARYLIASGIVIILIVIGATFMLARNIYNKLGGEPSTAVSITSVIADGNLDQSIPDSSNKHSLLSSILRMQNSLRKIVDEIKQGSNLLSSATHDMNQQFTTIHEASSQSADAAHATAAAIQQLSSCIESIANLAKETEANAERSTQLAQQGHNLVARSQTSFQQVSDQVGLSSQEIIKLREQSVQIGNIVNVIEDIAGQTNLLALNAAIEAARAGEQGRGFAVVADEVRTLASRTAEATSQITQTIANTQKDTENVVKAMEDTLPKVAESLEISGQLSLTLGDINDGAASTRDMIKEVSHSVTEQNQATESLAQHIEKISAMVKDTSDSVGASRQRVAQLEQLADKLDSSISYFKV